MILSQVGTTIATSLQKCSLLIYRRRILLIVHLRFIDRPPLFNTITITPTEELHRQNATVAALTNETHSLRCEVDAKIQTAVAAAEEALQARLATEWTDRLQEEISSALTQAAAQYEIDLQQCRDEHEKLVEEMTQSMRQQAVEQEVRLSIYPLIVLPGHAVYLLLLYVHVNILLIYPCFFVYFQGAIATRSR